MSRQNPYQPGGTLSGRSYIPRKADDRLRRAILDNQLFPFFLAARQSGKSSVLARTKADMESRDLRIAIVDLSEFPPAALSVYEKFVGEFADDILEQIEGDDLLEATIKKAGKRPRFLLQAIRAFLNHVGGRLVVCVDEVDVLTRCSFKDEFLSQVRALFNRRSKEPSLRRIQFVLAGAASCGALITDARRSPFNVGEDIGLDDLTFDGVRELVLLGWPSDTEQADAAVRLLLFWTGGSAYLCQHVLHRTYAGSPEEAASTSLSLRIERSISRVIAEAGRTPHFTNIARLLNANATLLKKWWYWTHGEIPDDVTISDLCIVGICRRDAPFKNRLYQAILGHRGPLNLLPSTTPRFEFDVFLSHVQEDKSVVREIATRLMASGLRVWFDEWQLMPGDLISLAIERGLEQSRAIVLFMSMRGFASDWVTLERQTALFRDPTNAERRFIPVRLDDSPVPVSLRGFHYIDWRSRSDQEFDRLLAACRGQISVSQQPIDAPEVTQSVIAKVVLVGDSGTGKTGLAMRLALNQWQPSDSTVGVWATRWKLPVSPGSGIEREILLWDVGGQADQRLLHQLYMDDTALAVQVFDGQREDLFETLDEWDRYLTRASRKPCAKLLVATRVDAGGLRVSKSQIEAFAKERGYAQFVETSAKTGLGCGELRKAIVTGIPWQDIPVSYAPLPFKRLKDEIIRLKESGRALMRFNELREMLQLRLSGEFRRFSDEELRMVLALLAGPGVVWMLEFGSWVLLQPERINAYAEAVIRTLRADEHDRGCLMEERVLKGDLAYGSSMPRLVGDDERLVLLAMHQMLVERGLCLRQPTEKGNLLIFPSYYRRERPQQLSHPAVFMSYRFTGFLDEIYATLVVRLHHTAPFQQDHLWRYAADFKTNTGKQLGVKLTRRGAGAGELEVYFDPTIAMEEKIIFCKYVHEHLLQHARDVERLRYYVCPECGTPVGNRELARKRLDDWLQGRPPQSQGAGRFKSRKAKEEAPTIICVGCERRVPLWDDMEQCFASPAVRKRVQELQEEAELVLDNESKERALVGEVVSTVALAGQISREFNVSDHGIDMEIEFKDDNHEATGKKLYLQLKSGDSYLRERKADGAEIFTIKDERHARYWMAQAFPVLLVIRTSEGEVRWMEVRDWLKRESEKSKKPVKRIVFDGERFDVMSVRRWRDKVLGL